MTPTQTRGEEKPRKIVAVYPSLEKIIQATACLNPKTGKLTAVRIEEIKRTTTPRSEKP